MIGPVGALLGGVLAGALAHPPATVALDHGMVVLVRARGGAGAAVATVMAAIGLRLVTAVLVGGFGAPLAPLAWQAVLAAVGIEAVAALLSVLGGRQLAGGAPAPGSAARS